MLNEWTVGKSPGGEHLGGGSHDGPYLFIGMFVVACERIASVIPTK
jgi:hypothetical protein